MLPWELQIGSGLDAHWYFQPLRMLAQSLGVHSSLDHNSNSLSSRLWSQSPGGSGVMGRLVTGSENRPFRCPQD